MVEYERSAMTYLMTAYGDISCVRNHISKCHLPIQRTEDNRRHKNHCLPPVHNILPASSSSGPGRRMMMDVCGQPKAKSKLRGQAVVQPHRYGTDGTATIVYTVELL